MIIFHSAPGNLVIVQELFSQSIGTISTGAVLEIAPHSVKPHTVLPKSSEQTIFVLSPWPLTFVGETREILIELYFTSTGAPPKSLTDRLPISIFLKKVIQRLSLRS